MEELLQLETGKDMDGEGKPKNKVYLETGLPESLQKALDEYIQGEKEQADYLRKKYLFEDEEVEDD